MNRPLTPALSDESGPQSKTQAHNAGSPEKTLTDAEVNATHGKILEAFKSQLKATVRE